VARAEEHVETDHCGFDRDSSHSLGTYVCDCGWSDEGQLELQFGTVYDTGLDKGQVVVSKNERDSILDLRALRDKGFIRRGT